ncbi:MAG: lipo-like protein [Alcaligenaceae bacterium]|nr:MAG: lipo-like protein [Alcaligenaceae bacterium]
MNQLTLSLGKWMATYLTKEIQVGSTAPPSNPLHLQETLRPGDVLLVEGRTRISSAIKYLTHSTWSHAALFIGSGYLDDRAPEDHCLIEADTVRGVCSSSLERFAHLHTRICRPVGLSTSECETVVQFALSQLGHQYDLRNVFDLARYLFPTPPIPSRYRRKLLELGSGDPTRAICSTLIAQAFTTVRYPILARDTSALSSLQQYSFEPTHFNPKHFSLLTPRDFDVSPYFQIIKPTLEGGFNFHDLEWAQ